LKIATQSLDGRVSRSLSWTKASACSGDPSPFCTGHGGPGAPSTERRPRSVARPHQPFLQQPPPSRTQCALCRAGQQATLAHQEKSHRPPSQQTQDWPHPPPLSGRRRGADTSRRAHRRARLIQLNCAQTLTTQALSGQRALQPTRHRGVTRQWRDAFNQSKRAHSQHQPSHPRTCLTPATLSLDLPHIIHPSITRGRAKGKASTARGCGRGEREDARKRVLKRGWTQQTQENSVWGVLYTVGKQAQPPTLVGGTMEPLPSRTMSSGLFYKTLSSKSTLNFTISKNKKVPVNPSLLRGSPE
jgi:hypothetical protein